MKDFGVTYYSDSRTANYYTLINDFARWYLFRSNHAYDHSCDVTVSYDYSCDVSISMNKQFNSKFNVIVLSGSHATHNFTPFKGRDKYYAVGGMERPWDVGTFKHTEGLYLFQSDNLIVWDLVQDDPIITSKTQGYNSCMSWKGSEFDTQPTTLWNGEKYIMILRDNVKSGIRFIQVGFSDDLIDWEFQPIKIKEFDDNHDNYYHMVFNKYKDFYIGLTPYYTDKVCCIKLMTSKDCITWDLVDDLFVAPPAIRKKVSCKAKFKNECHPVNYISIKNGIMNFFCNHNYRGYDADRDVYIKEYKLDLREYGL